MFLFANSSDPAQTPRFTASDLGLHCLPVTLLGVSRLQWNKRNSMFQDTRIGSMIPMRYGETFTRAIWTSTPARVKSNKVAYISSVYHYIHPCLIDRPFRRR